MGLRHGPCTSGAHPSDAFAETRGMHGKVRTHRRSADSPGGPSRGEALGDLGAEFKARPVGGAKMGRVGGRAVGKAPGQAQLAATARPNDTSERRSHVCSKPESTSVPMQMKAEGHRVPTNRSNSETWAASEIAVTVAIRGHG